MADVFLIIVAVVVFFILCIGGFYLLVNYQHPDDHNDAYFPKFVVLFGFVIAGCTVLMFPLDVANKEGFPGTFQEVDKYSTYLHPFHREKNTHKR
jgi:LMBR1 domain-containing protein 1